jgi:cytochrome P450
MISHILFQPELIEIIRDETAPAFEDDGTINTSYIAESCPRLKAIWLEVLRVYASSTSVRYITRDTQVGQYVLKKDHAIIFSAHQLHVENEAFGENTTEYDSLRFYERPRLENSQSFRPFGGGKTLCPGRHLARHVSLSFVATIFRHYNVSLAVPQTFPRRAEGKPAIGIIGGDDDLYIHLEERTV